MTLQTSGAISFTDIADEVGFGTGMLASEGSTDFDGTGDYLQIPTTSDFSFGTNDFTIECFFKRDVSGGLFQLSSNSNGYTTASSSSLAIGVSSASAKYLRIYSPSGGNDLTSTSPSADEWHHIAMVRNTSDNTLKIYLDGTLFHTISSDTTNYAYTYLAIGIFYTTSYPLDGHISNFRILNGTALYTSNFTPPTSPLTAITNTVLLTCQNNTGTITDASSSSHSITANGNSVADADNPFSGYADISLQNSDLLTFASHVGCSGTTHETQSAGEQLSLSNLYGLWPNTIYTFEHTTVGTNYTQTDVTYSYWTHTVPNNVTHMSMIAIGAGGGSGGTGSNYAGAGGSGGGTIWMKGVPVTPGTQFRVYVGHAGAGGTNYSTSGGKGGHAGIVTNDGSNFAIFATGGTGGITRYNNSNGSYWTYAGYPYFSYDHFQTIFGNARPIAVNGSRGGYGGPAYYNSAGGGGGGAGGWPNSNNVVPTNATSGTITWTTHYGGGNGRSTNSNGQYVNSWAASRTSGLDYGGAGGQGSTSYRTGGGGTGYDGRTGASAPTGYGDKGASGGSTDGSQGNSASYGGTYGGGGGSDDDDYSGAGARGGWGLVKLYYHNVNATWLNIL